MNNSLTHLHLKHLHVFFFTQAAHYGCGCWAENACNMNPYSTAVSTSGIPQYTQYTSLHPFWAQYESEIVI